MRIVRISLICALFAAYPGRAIAFDWTDLLKLFLGGDNIISGLSKGVGDAYTQGTRIADDQSLRNLATRLRNLETSMAETNSRKTVALSAIDAYLANQPGHPPWSDVQSSLSEIVINLKSLIEAVDKSGPDVIRMSGINTQSDLLGALKSQQGAYQIVAQLPEPESIADRQALGQLATQMRRITEQVRELETKLDSYLTTLPGGASHTNNP
jgi:uncharacterized coiled-coil protein SlyX